MKFHCIILHTGPVWHIMIPVDIKKTSSLSRPYTIAACTDPSIIKELIPADLDKFVRGDNFNYGYTNKLLYKDICKSCLKLYDPDKVKREIIIKKLKG